MGKLINVEQILNRCRNCSLYKKNNTSYPSTYINKEFGHFFDQYNQFDSFSSILPMLNKESSFTAIHNDLLPKPTPKQSQVASAIALSQIDQNEAGVETNLQQLLPPNQNQEKRQTRSKSENCLFLHHTYEERLNMLKKDIHGAYQNTFENSNVNQVKLMVACHNNPKIKNEFIRRKRPHDKLRRHDFKKST